MEKPVGVVGTLSKRRGRIATVISGSASGALVSLIVQPLDVIRTQMQAQAAADPRILGDAVATARDIWSHGGLRSFWRGSGATVWRLSIGLGLQFYTLETLKELCLGRRISRCQVPPGEAERRLSSGEAFLAGGLARTVAAAATCPFTIVKTRMEYVGAGSMTYKGTFHALAGIVRQEGPSGLLRGLGPTVLTNAPFSALYYMFYSGLKRRLQPDGESRPPVNFMAGTLAAIAATLLTQPTDMVRTQMQLGLSTTLRQSALGTLRSVVAKGGPRMLLTGAAPRIVKRTLQTALVWTLYEEMQPALTRLLRVPKV